jgi:hydrogenase maturation protein HypF
MSKEPRLSLFSLIDDSFSEVIKSKFTSEELNILKVVKKNNKLKTSSVGRLFDAVASLLNICDYNSYEGEAAIILENQVKNYRLEDCTNYCKAKFIETISPLEILKGIQNDISKGIKTEQIIANFLFTLASIILKVVEQNQVSKLCLSGGVFQNTTLVDMIIGLNQNKYKLYFNRNLAPNDENIAFGQIMYYLHCKE